MNEEKRVLIADFDEMGRVGTELACEGLENVKIMTAATKEEALAVINGEQVPDLVIVDPALELRRGSYGGSIDVKEGIFGVMNCAISSGVRVLIITTIPETVEQGLSVIGMQDCYEEIVQKAVGPDETSDAVVRALES